MIPSLNDIISNEREFQNRRINSDNDLRRKLRSYLTHKDILNNTNNIHYKK